MPAPITKTELRNVATAIAIGGRSGSWSSLDLAPLSEVGAMLDYSDDVASIFVASVGCTVLELDNMHDTADNAKSRAAARRYVLSSILRNARKAHNSDSLDLRAMFADVDEDGTRGYVIERTK